MLLQMWVIALVGLHKNMLLWIYLFDYVVCSMCAQICKLRFSQLNTLNAVYNDAQTIYLPYTIECVADTLKINNNVECNECNNI